MRPLALAAVLAALVGCSIPYEGKTFSAVKKPSQMAEGEERVVNDEKGEHAPGDPSGGHMGESSTEEGAGPSFEHTEPVVATASAFPKTAQPTGKPPVIESPVPVEGKPEWSKPSGE